MIIYNALLNYTSFGGGAVKSTVYRKVLNIILSINFKILKIWKKDVFAFETQLEQFKQRMVVNNFTASTINGYAAAIKHLHNFHHLPTDQNWKRM